MDYSDNSNEADGPSRRDFAVGAAVVGVAVGTASTADAAAREVVETNVEIKMTNGVCDAVVFHPAGRGTWPGVIFFPDALGLRPVFRDMGRRMAAEGYAVLVPNPFYRTAKAPVLPDNFNFANPEDRAKLGPLLAPLTADAVKSDSIDYVAFLDAHAASNQRKKVGVVGYCMGGPMTMRAAAAAPTRVGAACSFHGGGLVTDKPDSPHLLIPAMKANYYFGIAANDDATDPAAKDKLREACTAAKVPAEIKVYGGSRHGWCVKGNPTVYNEPLAEIAWANMLALYKRSLV